MRTRNEKAANASLARLEDNLRRVEPGTLVPPDDVDLAAFLVSGGRMSHNARRADIRRLDRLFDAYLGSLPDGSVEDNTLHSINIHIKHLTRISGGGFHRFSSGDIEHFVPFDRATDVNLPKEHKARFPSKCVVCGQD